MPYRTQAAPRAAQSDVPPLANAIVRLLETDPAGPEIASLFQEQRDLPTGDHLIDAQAWVRAHDPRHSPEERTRALVLTLRDRWSEQGGFASEVSERAIACRGRGLHPALPPDPGERRA